MTVVATTTGAPSHAHENWHAINWSAAHREVHRLQTRIVKAIQEGRRGKVKALQRLLTHSFSGKALAVRRVTENQGHRTPGVDGETWTTPESAGPQPRNSRGEAGCGNTLRRGLSRMMRNCLVRFLGEGRWQHRPLTRLAGYEVREYLLEKWGRNCAYCGATDRPLQVEHSVPQARHGPDRISNLTLACTTCNDAKGDRTAEEFGYPQIQAQQPLRDAAAVNATRWALYHQLSALGLPLETGAGGQTKWNRTRRDLPKAHWTDAAYVGASTPAILDMRGVVPLAMRAMGRQSRQMCRTNAAGFPDKAPKATSRVAGCRTGDMVRAVVPSSRAQAGVPVGRIAIRATGSCNLTTTTGTVQGIHVRYCQPLPRGDGYAYAKGVALPPQA
jgi:5-methylcytosine-specific restriction endonuclease McrA